MSRTRKFFMICGMACAAGIIMTIVGACLGGVQGLEKLEENHSWFNVGPMHSETNLLEMDKFESIKAEGNMDIAVISPDFAGDMDSDLEEWFEDSYNKEVQGNVLVSYREEAECPEVQVTEGVLTIKGKAAGPDAEVNLSTEDSNPDVIVFCSTKDLKGIDVNLGYGDLSIGGLSCDSLKANVNAGDIELHSMECGKSLLKVIAGDIALNDCKGSINAETESGDIEFDSVLGMDQFKVSLHSVSGDVQVNDSNEELKNFSADGGPNSIAFKTDSGDIEVDFFRDYTE